MALTKQTTFRGLPVPNGYYKIQEVHTFEQGTFEDGLKAYGANIILGLFSDETKKNLLEQTQIALKDFDEEGLNYTNYYFKLKELEEFKQATDLI